MGFWKRSMNSPRRLWAVITTMLMLYLTLNPALGIALIPLLDVFGLDVLLLLVSMQLGFLHREWLWPWLARAGECTVSVLASAFSGMTWLPWVVVWLSHCRNTDASAAQCGVV